VFTVVGATEQPCFDRVTTAVSQITFAGCLFTNNSASTCSGRGGAVFVGLTPIDYADCSSGGTGPSVLFENSTLTFTGCELSGNAATMGGGMFVGLPRPTFPSCQQVDLSSVGCAFVPGCLLPSTTLVITRMLVAAAFLCQIANVSVVVEDSTVRNNSVVVPQADQCGSVVGMGAMPQLGGAGIAVLFPTSDAPTYSGDVTYILPSSNKLYLVRASAACGSSTPAPAPTPTAQDSAY
jgi:hypothetical protein